MIIDFKMTLFDFSKKKSIAVLIGFLFAFFVSRLVVFFISNNIGYPFLQYNVIGEFHIHHFVYGIVILTITGFLSLFIPNRREHFWIFLFYGMGVGLVFDEFGLLLKLNPLYYQELSYIAVLIVTILLVISAFIEHRYRRIKFIKLEELKFESQKKLETTKKKAKTKIKSKIKSKIKPKVKTKKVN